MGRGMDEGQPAARLDDGGFSPRGARAGPGPGRSPPTRTIDHVGDEVADGVPVRIYRHERPAAGLVVYFHGGAFVVGSIGIMDNVARELAHAGNAVVVSVGYRLAPEHPYPAGLDDCETVTRWALDNATRFDLSSSAVVVAGESAGGNLATAVSLRLRDAGNRALAGQVLVYPCTDGPAVPYPSRQQFGRADWVWETYGGGRDLAGDPYAIPMDTVSLEGLPPALIVLAGCDALRDEGRAYAARLQEDGVEVDEACYPGQPHGFINYGFPAAGAALATIGGWLEGRFDAAQPAIRQQP